jgi:pimeloyl-ACP methyl ester carboxylesterase
VQAAVDVDDVCSCLSITRADVVAGSMGGWIAMNHAIYAPNRLRRLVLLGPMGLAPWRATFSVLGPFLSQRFRLTAAKLSVDHSLIDGAAAARFGRRLADLGDSADGVSPVGEVHAPPAP